MTTSPSRQVKSALTKAFPGTKFSVTTNGSVYVFWEMDLGCPVTCDAVAAITKPFDTHTNTANPYEDYYYFEGYRIELCPKFSEARKNWAAECVTAEWNEKDASWNKDWQQFRYENDDLNYHANKQYDNYLKNGVTSNLVDEYGQELIEKSWYYERQNQSQEVEIEVEQPVEKFLKLAVKSIPELTAKIEEKAEQTKAETKAFPLSNLFKPIIPISIEVSTTDILLDVQYPYANKQPDLKGYLESMEEKDDYRTIKTFVCNITTLTESDYDKFAGDLCEKHEWLKEKGGRASKYFHPTKNLYELMMTDEENHAKWEEQSYFLSLIITDGNRFIFVNPHGCGYARYVGFSTLSINEVRSSLGLSLEQKPVDEQQEKIEEILSARRDRWEEKQKSKTESYERLKAKHEQLSDSNYKASKDISKWIPFGQPILVGHHSEAHHRRDAEKIHSYIDKSIHHEKTAKYYSDKIESLSSNSTISSDDPDAISKLEAKLAAMQHRHQFMKDVNKILSSKKLSEGQKEEQLSDLNISPNKVASLIKNKKGFPRYELSNNTQNMSQVKKRLGQLKAKLAKAVESPIETAEYLDLGFTLVLNREIDRLQLIFKDKPPEETRNLLKSHGFKWSPSNSAWQRLLNGQAESSLYRLIINLQAL